MKYCSCCGVPIPDGQSICSMCYGDPEYGRDGYYKTWLEEQEELNLTNEELWERNYELNWVVDNEET